MQMAMKALPNEPNVALNADCASTAAVSPLLHRPEEMMTSAVSVRIIKVSINTPIMATTP